MATPGQASYFATRSGRRPVAQARTGARPPLRRRGSSGRSATGRRAATREPPRGPCPPPPPHEPPSQPEARLAMIVTTAQLFQLAYGKFAVGAYNINNAEQTMGLFQGCLASQAPVHRPALEGRPQVHRQAHARGHHPCRRADLPRRHLRRPPGPRRRGHLLRLHRVRLLQLGHDRCVATSRSRRTSPSPSASWTRAHAKGISVEAELGKLGGVEEDVKVDEGNAMPDRAGRGRGVRPADRLRLAWRSPSAPATARTSSRGSRPSTSR